MSARENAKLIASLAAAHAAIGALLVELTEPAAEESPPAPVDPVPTSAPGGGGCKHQHRTQIASFGAVEHWRCDECGYEYRR